MVNYPCKRMIYFKIFAQKGKPYYEFCKEIPIFINGGSDFIKYAHYISLCESGK